MDGQIPIFYMIGLLSREKDKDPRSRGIPWSAMPSRCSTPSACRTRGSKGPNDVHLIPEYYRLSRARKGPAVVLVGLETI